MPIKLNLTKRSIEELPLPEPGRRKDYYDTQIPALLLQVSCSGTKTFYVRKKVAEESRRLLVGRYPDLTIDDARKRALEICNAVAKGEDPYEKRRIARSELTFGELLDQYIESHARIHCIAWEEMQAVFRRYLSDWRGRKLTSIRKVEVQARLTQIGEKHGKTAANHTLTYARAAINWCIKAGVTKSENPWAAAQKFKLPSRERFILPDELSKFFSCLERLPNADVKDYLLVSLFTGARRANVLAMRWNQIDFTLGLWTIPHTKNGSSHTIPLTGRVLEILSARRTVSENEWVFPGTGKTGHLVEVKKGWQLLLKDAGIDDLRLHDLRRTLGSYLAMGNQSLHMIGKVLGHKSPTATQIYSRFAQDPVRGALEKAQSDMLEAAGLLSASHSRTSNDCQ